MPTQSPFREQMNVIRWRHSNERTSFRDELRMIPDEVYYVLALIIVLALVAFEIGNAAAGPLFAGLSAVSSAFAGFGVVLALGIALSCVVLLIAYINRDASRRGMSALVWTLLAIFVPYLIGIILYFVMREPLPYSCPQCGAIVNARFNYCTSCSFNLRPACPQCHHDVRPSDHYCPHCAYDLKGSSTAAPGTETPAR